MRQGLQTLALGALGLMAPNVDNSSPDRLSCKEIGWELSSNQEAELNYALTSCSPGTDVNGVCPGFTGLLEEEGDLLPHQYSTRDLYEAWMEKNCE